jgi:adenosylmethionine-8-amino-7-oxononanoate aminotransferase
VGLNAPAKLTGYGLNHGIALYNRRANGGKFGDIQLICPPLISTVGEIDEIVDRLYLALSDLEGELWREGLI